MQKTDFSKKRLEKTTVPPFGPRGAFNKCIFWLEFPEHPFFVLKTQIITPDLRILYPYVPYVLSVSLLYFLYQGGYVRKTQNVVFFNPMGVPKSDF